MALTKASFSMITGAPVNVLDFMSAAQQTDVLSGTGSIAVDVAIQEAIDSTGYLDAVYFPAGKYRLAHTLLIPNVGARTFFGDGPSTSVLVMYGALANTDIFARANTDPADSNNMNYMLFHDLGLCGNSNSRHGFNWLSLSRSRIENCYFTGLSGAAIYNTSSLVVTIQNCWISSCGWGIYGTGTGWTGMNGWNIHNCYIAISNYYGVYIYGGATGCNFSSNTFESNKLGGFWIGQDANAVTFDGCYFEENRDLVGSTVSADITLGANSYVASFGIRNCFFNGSIAGDDYYYPINLKYVYASIIENNTVNTGQKFIYIASGANLAQNTFGKVHFWTGNYAAFNEYQPTINFIDTNAAAYFVASGNKITQDFNPALKQGSTNLSYLGEFPYGGWVAALPGASTFTRYPNTGVVPGSHNGNQSVGLLHRSGGTVTLSKTVTNSPVLANGLVTFSLDVYCDSASSMFFTVALNDGGTQTFSTSSGGGSQSWATYTVTGHFSSATTSVNAVLTLATDGDYWVANPRIYACADASLMVGFAGTPHWSNTAAPTVGTWAIGDTVWNSAPASGGTPGWVCTTAGTPGTWKAMANLA